MTTINLYGVKDYIEDEKYADSVETAKKTFKEAFALYTDEGFESFDGWKRESQTAQHSVYSRQMSYGKLFALRSVIAKPLETVFAERWHGLDSVANWNNNIEFSSTVKKLSSHIDIAHYANRDVLMVKSRDYVAVRIWRKIDGDYYLIVRSTDVDDVPPSDRVRAIIHMGAGRFRQDPNDPGQTLVDLMLCIDFGGSIPRYIINTVMGKLMIKDFEETRKHIESIGDTDTDNDDEESE
uniref:START domain-containing protein n=1 Tax=Panagrellus redivivus TaxID=6233 RepID=A0A7E4V7P3_PANRE